MSSATFRRFNQKSSMFLFLFLFTIICQASADPIDIQQGTPQLFVDDYLIETSENLERILHQPDKDDHGNTPVIWPGDIFEGKSYTLEANGSIVHDKKINKKVLFAVAYSSEVARINDRKWESVRLYRFESEDGMTWSPGEWVFPRTKDDFLDNASGNRATNMDLFSCYYDDKDEQYPYKGWLWYANWGDDLEGIHLLKSRDGRLWERGQMIIDGWGSQTDRSGQKIQQDGRTLVGAGDVTIFYHDPIDDRFLALIKFTSPETVENGNRLRSRAYAFMKRMDEPFDIRSVTRVDLVPAAAEKNGDYPFDEYYASTAWRYGSLWLGGLKVWHGDGNYPWSAAGSAYLKLAVSRDGLHWHKVPFKNDAGIPEVFIPNGPEGGNNGKNDGGYITEFSTGPIVHGNELIYYYGASSYGKNHPPNIRVSGGGIFRARLRLDGFVSVVSGSLTTKQLQSKGTKLLLNSSGTIEVALLDSAGKQIDQATVTGDSLKHPVKFSGKELGELTAGKPFSLKFSSGADSHLYSFTIE